MSDPSVDDPSLVRRSVESFRREARFATIVQAMVARAHQQYGRIDPHEANRAASDIATSACALLLQFVYEDDAELKVQKALAEEYRAMAEKAYSLSPMPQLLVNRKDIR